MANKENAGKILDRAATAIREQSINPDAAAAASARVWETLSREMSAAEPADLGGRISNCEDVRALLPAYRAGRLATARELLVQDHLAECIGCRNEALKPGSAKVLLPWLDKRPTSAAAPTSTRKFAYAAALVCAVGLAGYAFRDQFLPAPSGPRASLYATDGPVYALNVKGPRLLTVGQQIGEQDWVRTPKGSHAMLRLLDGSMVEMKERSEFSVTMNRQDTTIHLERGSVIVQAAKRRTGHLNVISGDAVVSVTGTVFSVNRGTKGSRVSVVEGEVRVENHGGVRILHSGDQTSTNQSVEPVPVQDEIAWSRNFDAHVALLKEFHGLSKKLAEVRLPGLRYQSKLTDLLPENTMLYASIPNYGEALGQAQKLFEDRIKESAVLRQWWEQSGQNGPALSQVLDKIRTLSEYLGDEIVLAVTPSSQGNELQMVLLSEIKKPGLAEFLRAEMQRLGNGTTPPIEIVDSKSIPAGVAAKGAPEKLYLMLSGDIAALSPSGSSLQQVAQAGSNKGAFTKTGFGQRIASAYTDGVGLLFSADLSRITSLSTSTDPQRAAARRDLMKGAGIDDVQYLVVEQKAYYGKTQNVATLSFAGPRHGVASWLAAPAPMGSLNFISGNAAFVSSVVVKDPALLVDDILGMSSVAGATFNGATPADEIRKLETETGVRLRDDIASALGNDAVVALDGPLLPTPAWKVVVEANDPARLQQTIERLVAQASVVAQKQGHKALAIRSNKIPGTGDRMEYIIQSPDVALELHYAFSDGYLILAPDTNGLRKALRVKDGGNQLVRSHRFQSLLPVDRQPNFSALVYHNLEALGDAVGSVVAAGNGSQAIQSMLSDMKPTLVYAYGEESRIQVASSGGFFGLNTDSLAGSAGITDLLMSAKSGTTARRGSYK